MLVKIHQDDEFLFQGKRKRLVEVLKEKGIADTKVLEAMLKVPRHLFYDHNTARPALLDLVYSIKALNIGAGQTISNPYTVALQTQLIQVNPGDKILEIGTGCGYQTAVLIELKAQVYSIERQKELFDKTSKLLPALGYKVKKLHYGDGYLGLPLFAPFQKIIVTAAAPSIPKELVNQLDIKGVMIIPVGDEKHQELLLVTKKSITDVEVVKIVKCDFVPMLENKN